MEVQDQLAATLDWLKERMRRVPEEEMDPTEELERLLDIMSKSTEKEAKKFSKIRRDEFGSRTLHLVRLD